VKTNPAADEVGVLGRFSVTSPSPVHGSRARGAGSWAEKQGGAQRPLPRGPDPIPYLPYLAKPLTTAGLWASQKERCLSLPKIPDGSCSIDNCKCNKCNM